MTNANESISLQNLTPELEREVRQIQKLLQLAQSKGNQAALSPDQKEQLERESALAMARAQEKLARLNLDAAMVQDTAVAGGTKKVEEKREKTRISRSAKMRWQVMLWKALAEANFCMHWIQEVYEGKRGEGKVSKVPVKRHVVLGKESNVIVVRMMGEYLEDTIERMLPYPNNERMSRSANSWKEGAAERIAERLQAKLAEMKAETERQKAEVSTAIALRDVLQAEYQMNYDARYGEGAYARRLLRDEEWEKGAAERQRLAKEAEEKAEREWMEYLANETPEQKKQREREEQKERARAARASERSWRRWDREAEKESRRLDRGAKNAGRKAGDSISLDAQLGSKVAGKDRQIG